MTRRNTRRSSPAGPFTASNPLGRAVRHWLLPSLELLSLRAWASFTFAEPAHKIIVAARVARTPYPPAAHGHRVERRLCISRRDG